MSTHKYLEKFHFFSYSLTHSLAHSFKDKWRRKKKLVKWKQKKESLNRFRVGMREQKKENTHDKDKEFIEGSWTSFHSISSSFCLLFSNLIRSLRHSIMMIIILFHRNMKLLMREIMIAVSDEIFPFPFLWFLSFFVLEFSSFLFSLKLEMYIFVRLFYFRNLIPNILLL